MDVLLAGQECDGVTYGVSKKTRIPTDPGPNLIENGATEEEVEFLRGKRSWEGYHGQRVELNAVTSPQLVAWLEEKLTEHGIETVVPNPGTLEEAFRRALQVAHVNHRLPEITQEAARLAKNVPVPEGLGETVRRCLEETPERPWGCRGCRVGATSSRKN